MAYENVTVQCCINLHITGYEIVINDGEVKKIEKSNYCSDDCNDGCAES
jgi:hypothetical protein